MFIKVCDTCPNGREIHMLLLFLIWLFVNLLHSCTLLFLHTSSIKFNVRQHRHSCYLMKSFVIFKNVILYYNCISYYDATPGLDDVVYALKCECYVISQKEPLIRILMIVTNGKPDIFA